MPRWSLLRASLAPRRAAPIPPPLIPLQLPNPFTPLQDPAKPVIPIQETPQGPAKSIVPIQEVPQNPAEPILPIQETPAGRLQHELAYITVGIPEPVPTIQFEKRAEPVTIATTVTNAAVIVENGSGSTIGTTTLTGVKSGSMIITFPGTTATIPPLASISNVYTLTQNPNNVAATPSAVAAPAPDQTPSVGIFTSVNLPSSQQILSSLLPTPAVPSSAANTGNNNLGLPGVSSSNAGFSSDVNSNGAITAAASIASSPTTLATTTALTGSSNGAAGSPIVSDSASGSQSPNSFSAASTSPTFASSSSSQTGTSGANGGSTVTTTAPPSASTSAVTSSPSTGGGSNVTAPVVGGVVGGLAGLALILVLLLFLFRWIRRKRSGNMTLRSIDNESLPPGTSHSSAPMTQNPAFTAVGVGAAGAAAAGGAGAAGIGGMIKRMTGGSTATNETSVSGRGFQKMGGRRLESVLTSGGDGYDDPTPSGAQTPNSFYKNWGDRPYETPSKHSSLVVGPATPFRRGSATLTSAASSRPISGQYKPGPPRLVPPSPAQPMISESGNLSPPLARPRPIDPLGRSRHSQDGSRGSKFTEDL